MGNVPISVIIQKCTENDRCAQHDLFNLYKRKINALVCKTLGGAFDNDDIVQQVFIAIFNGIKGFKGNSTFDTWVYRICAKICTTQLRKKYRKRQPALIFDSEGIEANASDRWSDPAADIEQRELRSMVYGALDKLSADKRVIVVLYEMEGKSLEEIAGIVDKPVGTVKSRLFHGRKALEKHLRGFCKP